MEEKRLRKLAGLNEDLNETLTTKDFRDLAVIFGSAATDNLSVKVMTQVVKSFIELAKKEASGFNEDRFITLLRRESPRLGRALKGEKEPEDSKTNETELNEAVVNANELLSDMRDISDEFKRDRAGVRDKLRQMLKKDNRKSQITKEFLSELINRIFETEPE